MSLIGELSAISSVELFQLLARSGKSGMLTVNREKETRHVFFYKGAVTGVHSSRSKDRLGAFLLRMGLVSEEDLERVRLKQVDTSKQAGELFCSMKILSESDLKQALMKQVMEIVFDILTWTKGGFVFEERPLKRGEKSIAPISVEFILLESARRQDEWRRIRDVIPDPKIVFVRGDKKPPASEPLQNIIWETLETPRSASELADIINESEFSIFFELRNMLVSGLIRRDEELERKREAIEMQRKFLEDMATDLIAKRAFHDAMDYIQDLLQLEPGSQTAERLMSKARNELIIDARRMIASDKIVPVIRRSFSSIPPEMMTLSPEEGFVFSRLDGRTNIKMLQYLTQLPKDQLYIILHKFSRMGLIYFSKRKPVKSSG